MGSRFDSPAILVRSPTANWPFCRPPATSRNFATVMLLGMFPPGGLDGGGKPDTGSRTRQANKKGRLSPALSYAYATPLGCKLLRKPLRPARPEDGGALIAVRRGNRGLVRGVVRRHHALDLRLAHGEGDLGAAEPEIGELAIAHAQQLSFGSAQPVVGFDGLDGALGLPAEPQQGLGQAVGNQGGARIGGTALDHAAVIEREAELGEI